MLWTALKGLRRKLTEIHSAWVKLGEPPPGVITLHDEHFTAASRPEDTPRAVAFEDIDKVTLYKRDEITTDLICCDIEFGAPGHEQAIAVHEEMIGFQELMTCFGERLPGFDTDWFPKVAFPPFATNITVVFQKSPKVY